MGKKKKLKAKDRAPRDSYDKKYAQSQPIVSKDDVKTILKKTLTSSVHAPIDYVGKYSRLYEDYDY